MSGGRLHPYVRATEDGQGEAHRREVDRDAGLVELAQHLRGERGRAGASGAVEPGGIQHLPGLAALPYVDASNVLAYLRELGSPTAVARTGWFLEQRASEWYVSQDALDEMRSMLGKGPYYLSRDNEAGRWVPAWRLYLPRDADDLERWVHE